MTRMLSRATKAAMLLAAFSLAFSLVCPVAVTPIFVQNQHHAPAIHLTFAMPVSAILPPAHFAQAQEAIAPEILSQADLSCTQRC